MIQKAAICITMVFLCVFLGNTFISHAASIQKAPVVTINEDAHGGGGYAATGQLTSAGYTTKLYDASSGLPTSDANYILGSSDGYIWIGGYSGIIKYDGSVFTRLDTSNGMTNGRCVFEDSKGRIWVGTNDNGVVMLEGDESTHITYKEGLPSSSIRAFAEDADGYIYVGTTAGVCSIDPSMKVSVLSDPGIDEDRVLRLDSDSEGTVYGQSKNGHVFRIKEHKLESVYSSGELGALLISSILADPFHPGKVYLSSDNNVVYYGNYGETVRQMKRISVAPLSGIHWLNYDCGRLWVSSNTTAGYLDERYKFHVLKDLPVNSGIEMITSDFQGNLWFASSTQGVMKIVTNNFVDITEKAGLPAEVSNVTYFHHDDLYIGTNAGLQVVNRVGNAIKTKLTTFIGNARIRCIVGGANDDLWIGTFSNDLGLVHYAKDGTITNLTTEDGLPNNEIRCVDVTSDRMVVVGTNGGIAMIRGDKIVRTVAAGVIVKNDVFLTVEEGNDGLIYTGTDGGGIYIFDGDEIKNLGRDDGLTSDVIMRIKKDEKRNLLWIVTSNSIEYLKDGKITEVSSFPYNNNYDLYFDNDDDMWIVSSYGIFMVKAYDMVENTVTDYRLYTMENGLTSTPTSLSYSALSDDGNLYIAGRSGVCRVNIDHFSRNSVPVMGDISSVYCGNEQIFPNDEGTYTIPSSGARIRITAAVLDYSLLNPLVNVYMDGQEDQGITVERSKLQPIEYTNLAYGDYKLIIKVTDITGNIELLGKEYRIIKKPRLSEMPFFRLLLVMFFAIIGGMIVWRFLKSTVINTQYEEIRKAKEEAERANTAKSAFLANMSHEIRTPINTIMGMNEMVMREDPTDVPKPYFMSMMNYAFDIRNASESLLSLINDLLDMSKIESGKMHLVEQEYDTQEMLRSIVSMIRVRSTEKELTFDVVVDEILPERLFGDQGKIKQVVLNLLTNALKYTEKGGFALFVYMDEREDDTCKIRFVVKDTGIGVKAEDMDKLFSAYERLDEQRNSGIQGTGLGLDISRKMAELMNGTLTCTSVYGKGSEFVLTVSQKIVDKTPVGIFMEHDESKAEGPYVPQFIAPDADILVVDDNPMNLSVIKGLLKATKVFVSTASSGEECLEMIKDTVYHVVLLDHMMPGMDGVETVAEIRKTYPDLPVYALTANSSVGEDFYVSAGFNGYLSKPIDSMTLEKTIMKHLPEEIMEKPEAADAVAELTEIPPEMQWIYEIDSIDVKEGISNSGGISSYLFSLNLFFDTIDENAKVIRNAYDSGNIRLYTIKVHALKSSAKFIGDLELSKICASLEDAGNKEDMAFIDENTGRLMAEYEAYKEKFARLQAEPDNSGKEMIPEEELKEAYMALADMIPQLDYDAVEMILEQVGEYALPEKDAAIMRELAKKLKVFDWDGMEELIPD